MEKVSLFYVRSNQNCWSCFPLGHIALMMFRGFLIHPFCFLDTFSLFGWRSRFSDADLNLWVSWANCEHCTAIYCLVYQCVKCITLSKVIAECVLVLVLLVHCVCNVCWQCAWNFWNVFLRLQLIPFFPAAWSRSADSAMLNFSRDFKFHCVWIIAVIFLWTVIDIHSLFVSSLKYVISRRHCACYFFFPYQCLC